MKPKIKKLAETLQTTSDGGVACDAIMALGKHASKGDNDAKVALADYMESGQVLHMREFACSLLAEVVDESDIELASRFEKGLSDELVRYWSILGYANTIRHKSYEALSNHPFQH